MKRTTLILSVALVLSVAVNLLIAGMVIGHRFGGDRRGPHELAGILDRSLWAVPRDLRGDVRSRLHGGRDGLETRMQAVREARRAANEALRARPVDPASAEAALARLRAATGDAQAAFHGIVLDVMLDAQQAGTLPPPPDGHRGPDRRTDR